MEKNNNSPEEKKLSIADQITVVQESIQQSIDTRRKEAEIKESLKNELIKEIIDMVEGIKARHDEAIKPETKETLGKHGNFLEKQAEKERDATIEKINAEKTELNTQREEMLNQKSKLDNLEEQLEEGVSEDKKQEIQNIKQQIKEELTAIESREIELKQATEAANNKEFFSKLQIDEDLELAKNPLEFSLDTVLQSQKIPEFDSLVESSAKELVDKDDVSEDNLLDLLKFEKPPFNGPDGWDIFQNAVLLEIQRLKKKKEAVEKPENADKTAKLKNFNIKQLFSDEELIADTGFSSKQELKKVVEGELSQRQENRKRIKKYEEAPEKIQKYRDLLEKVKTEFKALQEDINTGFDDINNKVTAKNQLADFWKKIDDLKTQQAKALKRGMLRGPNPTKANEILFDLKGKIKAKQEKLLEEVSKLAHNVYEFKIKYFGIDDKESFKVQSFIQDVELLKPSSLSKNNPELAKQERELQTTIDEFKKSKKSLEEEVDSFLKKVNSDSSQQITYLIISTFNINNILESNQ